MHLGFEVERQVIEQIVDVLQLKSLDGLVFFKVSRFGMKDQFNDDYNWVPTLTNHDWELYVRNDGKGAAAIMHSTRVKDKYFLLAGLQKIHSEDAVDEFVKKYLLSPGKVEEIHPTLLQTRPG
jgi:hypothetical protein